MTQTIREIMTPDPVVQPATSKVAEAARIMRDDGIGDVLVERDGALCGIVTDRDIVVRAVAQGGSLDDLRLGDICTTDLVTVEPDASVDDAINLMRDKALRRVAVCHDGQPLGIVSMGDLAMARDPHSALADVSAASPNN